VTSDHPDLLSGFTEEHRPIATSHQILLFLLQEPTSSEKAIMNGEWKSLYLLIMLTCTGLYDLNVGGMSIGAGSFLSECWNNLFCTFRECCDRIPYNLTMLETSLREHLFGQHIAYDIVIHAIKAHFREDEPIKALALSFNGFPGSGKTLVSQFIIKSLFKAGIKSKYVHFFSGRIHFPLESKADIYRIHLIDWIRGNVSLCERSLFVFDEVDKMPEGVLDAVKPFLNYHEQIDGIDFRKAMFIFLSNTGSNVIAERLVNMWRDGRKREDILLNDFEELIRKGIFNHKGGFYMSDTIQSNLIDHYIPFLPLEEPHVKQCIQAEYRRRGVKFPHKDQIDEVFKDVEFGPEPHKVFSTSGCKRISSKVATALERKLSLLMTPPKVVKSRV
jgi:hypothetical protein